MRTRLWVLACAYPCIDACARVRTATCVSAWRHSQDHTHHWRASGDQSASLVYAAQASEDGEPPFPGARIPIYHPDGAGLVFRPHVRAPHLDRFCQHDMICGLPLSPRAGGPNSSLWSDLARALLLFSLECLRGMHPLAGDTDYLWQGRRFRWTLRRSLVPLCRFRWRCAPIRLSRRVSATHLRPLGPATQLAACPAILSNHTSRVLFP